MRGDAEDGLFVAAATGTDSLCSSAAAAAGDAGAVAVIAPDTGAYDRGGSGGTTASPVDDAETSVATVGDSSH
jgi:hypothetical protein